MQHACSLLSGVSAGVHGTVIAWPSVSLRLLMVLLSQGSRIQRLHPARRGKHTVLCPTAVTCVDYAELAWSILTTKSAKKVGRGSAQGVLPIRLWIRLCYSYPISQHLANSKESCMVPLLHAGGPRAQPNRDLHWYDVNKNVIERKAGHLGLGQGS